MFYPIHNNDWYQYFIIPLLYAEIHYTFRGLYSRLKSKEPEIIFDVPERLEPSHALPVLLVVKDAHRYPVEIDTITITAEFDGKKCELYREELSRIYIDKPYWDQILLIRIPEYLQKTIYLDVQLTYFSNMKKKTIRNDNYRHSRHGQFKVQVDAHPLPKTTGWFYGDLHYHSNYTSDQVEFGASLPATIEMARAMGLSFLAITDHSYDLDDVQDDYLHNDPALKKWDSLNAEINSLNEVNEDLILIPGEEVSAGNSKNRNVHLIVLNHPQFIPGYGDSAEKWLQTRPQLSLTDILEKIDPCAIAIAAHPEIRPPWLQWLLIRRGKWNDADYSLANLKALQFWNGEKDKYFVNGLKKWVELLLRGQKIAVVAGNDAHGNFNRFRQIGFPFLTIKDNSSQVFGRAKTAVFITGKVSVSSVITAMGMGRMIVTDGPFAEMIFQDADQKIFMMGDTIRHSAGFLTIRAISTPTWGYIRDIAVLLGDVKNKKENRVRLSDIPPHSISIDTNTFIKRLPSDGYLRLEVYTELNGTTRQCYTNPIYIRNSH